VPKHEATPLIAAQLL